MNLTLALPVLVAMLLPVPQIPGAGNVPLRNTFVVAAETVIDDASRVDLKADLAVSDAQMKQVDSARRTLDKIAEDEHEKEAAVVVGDMVSQLTACRLQATNGANTDTCRSQFERARSRAMEAIGKHKEGGAWADGVAS